MVYTKNLASRASVKQPLYSIYVDKSFQFKSKNSLLRHGRLFFVGQNIGPHEQDILIKI